MKRGLAASRKRQRKNVTPYESVHTLPFACIREQEMMPSGLRLPGQRPSRAICNGYLRLPMTNGPYTIKYANKGHTRKVMIASCGGLAQALRGSRGASEVRDGYVQRASPTEPLSRHCKCGNISRSLIEHIRPMIHHECMGY